MKSPIIKILLFIPTYNCQKQITRVLSKLTPELTEYFSEILVIDNISSDDTYKVASDYVSSLKLPVKVIQNSENVNLGGTHKVAFEYAIDHSFDYCAILHGDDQAELKDFIDVFKNLHLQTQDFVLGSRFSWSSKRHDYSIIRTIGNLFFNMLASFKFKRIISDFGGSGLNLFKVEALKELTLKKIKSYDNDLTFHIYLLQDSLKARQRVHFYPINWWEFDQKSNVKVINQSIKVLRLLLN